MQKHVRIAREAAASVLDRYELTLEQVPGKTHTKFAVIDKAGVVRSHLIISCTPRTGDTEQRNMARQQAQRVVVRLGLTG